MIKLSKSQICDKTIEGGNLMVNVNKLKAKMVEKGTNVELLAKSIGMNKSTLYRKLNKGGEDFSIKEIRLIASELDISDEEAIVIFFAPNVA